MRHRNDGLFTFVHKVINRLAGVLAKYPVLTRTYVMHRKYLFKSPQRITVYCKHKQSYTQSLRLRKVVAVDYFDGAKSLNLNDLFFHSFDRDMADLT